MSARALNAPLLVPFNKSYVSPLISLVGALMVNTNLNLLGFLEASGRSRSSPGSSRALPSPPIYPFIPLLLSCQQGWHAPWAPGVFSWPSPLRDFRGPPLWPPLMSPDSTWMSLHVWPPQVSPDCQFTGRGPLLVNIPGPLIHSWEPYLTIS